jgi:cob(I)alamin adenosyltransferase
MKGRYCGELEAARMADPYITIEQYGRDVFVNVQNPPRKDDVQMAHEGLVRTQEAMFSSEYNLIIFDEITMAYYFHLLSLRDMLEIIARKPEGVEVVFTGRYAPPEAIAAADLVTEMVEVKHY